MTAAEFKRAFSLADDRSVDLTKDIEIFDGFGLSGFGPVVATVRQVACLMRWQALQMNGQWDAEALTEVKDAFRHKVTMVG